ncbi:MAG: tail fiber protein [Podoviridae sp. ctDWo9]|nr:MAG: tail fiber protein [Podoviridae sp. ctDWo9]
MADLKISQLTALLGAGAADADVLPVVDTSATTTKKISLSELVEFIVASSAFVSSVGTDWDSDQGILANTVFG